MSHRAGSLGGSQSVSTPKGAEPAPEALRSARRLVMVSAGLSPRGGGTAAAGRLLARAARHFASEGGGAFELIELSNSPMSALGVALRAAARQIGGPRKTALLFDHLGPSRVEGWLPAGLRSSYMVYLHGIEVWTRLSGDRRRALARARRLLANSSTTVARARALNPGLPAADVVPLALEERPADGAVDAPLLARCGEGFFLTVARMSRAERYKGHDAILEALAALGREAMPARAVFAGEGDDARRLAARAAELGVERQVVFTGFVSEATREELYRRCRALVMPSRDEGFGLAYLEAMRAGRACVASPGSGAAEIVRDGETGLLVPYGDAAALAGALRRLLTEESLALHLGDAGLRRFRAEYTEERFQQRIRPHLADLMSADVRN